MNTKTIKISLHLIVWILFLIAPVFILPKPDHYVAKDQCRAILFMLTSILTIPFFYFNYYYATPKFYFKKKYLSFLFSYIAYIAIVFLLLFVVIKLILGFCEHQDISIKTLFKVFLPRFILILIVSFGMKLTEKVKFTKAEKTKAELDLLKAQIDPHFLFNVLNDIYGQALTKSDLTAESIAKLSNLMRYTFKEATATKVGLNEEIKYLKSYISLQNLRLTDKTKVDFQLKGDTSKLEVPPMLFISFVENAFKYGVTNEKDTEIDISLKVDDNIIDFIVENEILPNRANQVVSNKIGIKNVKNRLDLIYSGRHNLNIMTVENKYKVHLKIET